MDTTYFKLGLGSCGVQRKLEETRFDRNQTRSNLNLHDQLLRVPDLLLTILITESVPYGVGQIFGKKLDQPPDRLDPCSTGRAKSGQSTGLYRFQTKREHLKRF